METCRNIAARINLSRSAAETVLRAMKTYRCTIDTVLLAVETAGSRLAVETAGASARGGRGAFPPPFATQVETHDENISLRPPA